MRAFAVIFLAPSSPFSASFFAFPFWLATKVAIAAMISSSDRCAYQMSIVPIFANPAIASR